MINKRVMEDLLWELGFRVYVDNAYTPIDDLHTEQIAMCVKSTLSKLGQEVATEEWLNDGLGPAYITAVIELNEIYFYVDEKYLLISGTTDVDFTVSHLIEGEASIQNLLLLYNYIRRAKISTAAVNKHIYIEGIHTFDDWYQKFTDNAEQLVCDLAKFERQSVFGGTVPKPSWSELKYTIIAFMYQVFG